MNATKGSASSFPDSTPSSVANRVVPAPARGTRRRCMRLALAGCLLQASLVTAAGSLPAQTDEGLRAIADSTTVGDYCRIATLTVAAPSVQTLLGPADAALARLSATVVCEPSLADVTLLMLHGDQPASLLNTARLRTQQFAGQGRAVFDAMDNFALVVRRADRIDPIKAAIGDSANRVLVRVTTVASSLLLMDARDSALARLARYERKLGPGSARLNFVEVLLNYSAQRIIPGFKATPSRGPGPWELVAAYVPTYGTVADRKAQAVSASEFGLRRYLFGEQFGAPGWKGILRPTYWAAGALVVSDRNGALVWPWQDRQRTGGYLSWGSVKLGYVPGRQGEWLLSRQIQLVPLVF